MSIPEDRMIKTNGQEICAKEWSKDGPLLVLLHHLTGDSNIWNLIAPLMATDYQVMAMDIRGHGCSSKPLSGYNWVDDLSEDVIGLVRHYTSDSAIVVGRSLGAMVSIPVAVKIPEIITDIVLIDPPAFDHETYYDYFGGRLDFMRLPFHKKVEQLIDEGVSSSEAKTKAERSTSTAPGMLQEYIDGKASYRTEDWLPRVSCRTHLIYGNPEIGGVVTPERFQRLKQLCTFSHISQWVDSGHGLGIEEPDRMATELKNFLIN